MDNFKARVVEEAVKSQIGRKAAYRQYDRSLHSPMNFVLDEAERQLGKEFVVYWVDGGIPEHFALPGFSPMPVVFNSRYVEMVSFVRMLMVGDEWADFRIELSERICLRLIAELCLRHGDPDLAVLAFLKSIIGQGIYFPTTNLLLDLEEQPIEEDYMATWFFGLIHEIGHAAPLGNNLLSTGLLTDESIERALDIALSSLPFPENLKHEAREKALTQRSGYVLGIDHVRSEALADIFAASVLFQSTLNIMQKKFRIEQFIAEMTIFINVVIIIERCKRAAILASTSRPEDDAALGILFTPAAFHIRAQLIREYLLVTVAYFLSHSKEPSPETYELVNQLLDSINSNFTEILSEVESGMARALRFALFPKERETDLLMKFTEEASSMIGRVGLIESQKFCQLANSLQVTSPMVQALKRVIENPNEVAMNKSIKNQAYIVPWIKGPGEFSRPFGLDTKYGHLVFVFTSQAELYDEFFNQSAKALAKGYTLETTVVIAPDQDRLTRELTTKMPSGKRFGIVVEGSKTFLQFMQELADDTIWPDP